MAKTSDFVVKIFVEDFLLRVCSRLFQLTWGMCYVWSNVSVWRTVDYSCVL